MPRTWGPDDGGIPLSSANLQAMETDITTAGGAVLFGAGVPTGVVVAPVGTVYRDTAATRGAITWIKVSGADSTGWTVMHGDTGWRNISPATPSTIGVGSWASPSSGLFLRRINASCYLRLSGATGVVAAKYDKQLAMPTGFHGNGNDDNSFSPVTSDTLQLPLGQFGMREGNSTQFWFASAGNFRGGLHQWVTAQEWPLVLPGTAA